MTKLTNSDRVKINHAYARHALSLFDLSRTVASFTGKEVEWDDPKYGHRRGRIMGAAVTDSEDVLFRIRTDDNHDNGYAEVAWPVIHAWLVR